MASFQETQVHARPARRVRRVPRQAPGCAGVLNALALVLLAMTCIAGMAMAAVFRDPQVLGIFPGGAALVPPTNPRPYAVAGQGTPAEGVSLYPTFQPTWTPTITPTPSDTPLPATATLIPSETATLPPMRTRTPSPTVTRTRTPSGPTPTPRATRAAFVYTLQNGTPTYLANYVNSAGCDWFGFAGQAFDLTDRPVIGLNVHVEGDGLNLDALTGSRPQYGPAGYEIYLANRPKTTTDTYRVQLRNNTGTALSDWYTINTFGDCKKNLVLVNFQQNH